MKRFGLDSAPKDLDWMKFIEKCIRFAMFPYR